jgi:hypothetical protein
MGRSFTIHRPYMIPKVSVHIMLYIDLMNPLRISKGNLIATHRKVHLFDIDIPGKIRFKVIQSGNSRY